MYLAVKAFLLAFEIIFNNSERCRCAFHRTTMRIVKTAYPYFRWLLFCINSHPSPWAVGLIIVDSLNSCAQQTGSMETVPQAVLAAVIQFGMGCVLSVTACLRSWGVLGRVGNCCRLDVSSALGCVYEPLTVWNMVCESILSHSS